ncbi:MAG TPA: alpha/beta fold hydrolase [Longimicrobiales bacterium]
MNVTQQRESETLVQRFRIATPQGDVDDLTARLGLTRWPADPAGAGWERGVPGDYMRELARYWHSGYNWRDHEAQLNQWPQFTTDIDGQTIHFVHARSANSNALPLMLLHGWPGSFVEFVRVIGPLIDPGANGGNDEDAFHVIIPSIPGFGFSVPVRDAGWNTGRAGRAFGVLMERLGYERYGVHGSDVGAGIAGALTSAAHAHVAGAHFASDPPSAVSFAMFTGDPAATPGLSAEEKAYVEQLKQNCSDGGAYLQLQSTRPQTLAYALTDSPAAQLAWIVEKFREWTDATVELPEDAVDIDQLLTNVSIYWFTGSGASAAHFLYESMRAQEWGEASDTPTGFAIFGAHPVVRRLMDPDRRIRHWSEFTRGGHFPAMEVPELLAADLRDFFRPLR